MDIGTRTRKPVIMTSSRPVAYISGPLHAAHDLAQGRLFYEYLAHMTTDPDRQAHLTPVDVFRHDLDKLVSANAIIADIGQPSSGVGAELGIACERRMPIVALYGVDERTSRFVLGMLFSSPPVDVVSYVTRQACGERTAQLGLLPRE